MGSRPFPAVTGDYRRQAAYAAYLLILVFVDSFTEAKKTPVARNPPGLLAAPEGSHCKPPGPVIQKGLSHLFAMIEFNRTLAGGKRRKLYCNQLHGVRSIATRVEMSTIFYI